MCRQMANDLDQIKKEAIVLGAPEHVELAGELVENTGWRLVQEQKHFAIALIEALIKCAPVFVIQFLAIYPLLALGQGQEAMRGLLNPGPVNISWFLFPIALSYSCVLTASFLFFLLGEWNYPADKRLRAFCRIWVPSVLTLIVGLMWPVMAELTTTHSKLWDFFIGLVNGGGTLALAVAAWQKTKPVLSSRMIGFAVVSTVLLLVSLHYPTARCCSTASVSSCLPSSVSSLVTTSATAIPSFSHGLRRLSDSLLQLCLRAPSWCSPPPPFPGRCL